MSEKLSLSDLTPDEIERLPDWLCKRIGDSSRLKDSLPGVWILSGGRPEWWAGLLERPEGFKELLERTLETLPLLAAERDYRLSEANIEKILDVILSDAPRPVSRTNSKSTTPGCAPGIFRNAPSDRGRGSRRFGSQPTQQERARLPLETGGQTVRGAPLGGRPLSGLSVRRRITEAGHQGDSHLTSEGHDRLANRYVVRIR